MKTFSEIVKEVGHTDKNTSHTYGPWYDLWLAKYRDRPVNVLEVGVCVFGGGCVLSFAEYFPQGNIYAADIDRTRCTQEVFNHPRINFIHGDDYHPDFVTNFTGLKFDVIVDDASHEVQDQIKLLKMLRPYLRDDGIYIVEDCCTGHWLPSMKELRALGLQQTIIDMSTDRCYDNTLIKFEVK